ncbi:uncharacterized protein L969DRAFT_88940 [Mixia osmundae IAM 14324]|nr:uncharacterized protein L969DRAFT_88940 [Mixia osmundae IAM 14324]KEI38491.1 hypothetical protein L969DRAFT_88940 [Mixia osmundae IAM 14324]
MSTRSIQESQIDPNIGNTPRSQAALRGTPKAEPTNEEVTRRAPSSTQTYPVQPSYDGTPPVRSPASAPHASGSAEYGNYPVSAPGEGYGHHALVSSPAPARFTPGRRLEEEGKQDVRVASDGSTPAKRPRMSRDDSVGERDNDRVRKDNHKEVERKRRLGINLGIEELGKIIPGENKNKGDILIAASGYIKELKEAEASNIEKWTLEKLMTDQHIQELQAQVESSKKMLAEAKNTLVAKDAEIASLRRSPSKS